MRIDVYVTVWGARFVEKFLTYSLASQLAPANLPAVGGDVDFVYHIYTDRASEPLFAPRLAELGAHADVQFAFYEDIAFKGGTLKEALDNSDPATVKHNVQRLTSRHLLSLAAEQGSDAVILLDSDFIFADGAWAALIELHRAGAKAVCGMFLRLEEESAVPLLPDVGKGIAAPDLVSIGLRAMHPSMKAMFLQADPFTSYPSQLNWRVGPVEGETEGYIAHCFFPHPLLVVPRGGINYSGTMDYDYALRVADDEQIHLVTSSDELLFCKMTPASYNAGAAGAKPDIGELARFIVSNTNLRHALFMSQPIRYRAGGDAAVWQETEERSTRFVEAIYRAAELVVAGAKTDARTMVFLKSFLGPIEDFVSPQTAARLKGWM
jgi:hypothetical protein